VFNDLSKRVKAIKQRPTLAVSNLASQRMIQRRDVIELGAGEADFDAGVFSAGGERPSIIFNASEPGRSKFETPAPNGQ
jgi:hypothetical protein